MNSPIDPAHQVHGRRDQRTIFRKRLAGIRRKFGARGDVRRGITELDRIDVRRPALVDERIAYCLPGCAVLEMRVASAVDHRGVGTGAGIEACHHRGGQRAPHHLDDAPPDHAHFLVGGQNRELVDGVAEVVDPLDMTGWRRLDHQFVRSHGLAREGSRSDARHVLRGRHAARMNVARLVLDAIYGRGHTPIVARGTSCTWLK